MINKTAPYLLFFLLLYAGLQAQMPNHILAGAQDQLENRGEVYLKFKPTSQPVPGPVLNAISVDHGAGNDWVTAYANKKGFETLLEYTNQIEILHPPSLQYKPSMKSNADIKTLTEWDFYPTYEAYLDLMNQFAENYPQLCTIVNIGESELGRELLVARISDNATHDEGEAQFLYTSSMHGDETGGFVLMLHLIDYLLKNYGTNSRVTHLVNNLDIWINPLANPDGTYFGGNNTVYGSKRFNANNVDLNRNFSDPDDGPHPDGNEYQAETEAFMAMAEDNRFVLSANFHGGAEVFNYPWDTWSQLHADDAWWYYVGREWADTAQQHSPAGYMNDLNNGVTNGYAWYPTAGSRQDHMNYFHHCREVTLEISSVKLVQESALNDLWEYNYRSFLNYMEQALFGISGQVTNEQTGAPVMASVVIEGHDELNTWVISSSTDGWYYRPIFEGAYELTFFAPHYEPKVISGVESVNRMQTQLDVALKPTNSNISTYDLQRLFTIAHPRADNKLLIQYNGDELLKVKVLLADLTGRVLYSQNIAFGQAMPQASIPLGTRQAPHYLLSIIGDRAAATFHVIQN